MKPDIGIYIHIPFCRRKCLYCDFCSFTGIDAATRSRYVDALVRELRSYSAPLAPYTVNTVFIGGGTPSLLAAEEAERVFDALRTCFDLAPDAEITSEVNPATADGEKLARWRAAGVNRLSIGVQSFSDTELRALGRLHTADEAEAFYRAARRAGFANIGLDLMYGIPGQTAASLAETLRRAVALSPEHISAYSLQVEEGTPFYDRRETLALPGDDENADLYDLVTRELASAGYRHYEISNYAKPGYESRHNLRYWRMSPYIGVGVAAYSYFEGARYGHGRDLAAYLADDFSRRPPAEPRGDGDTEEEYIMLALRLADGIDDEDFRRTFGVTFTERYGARMAPFVAEGLATRTGRGWALTERGMYVSLALLAEILDT